MASTEEQFRAASDKMWIGSLWMVLLIGPGIVTLLIGFEESFEPDRTFPLAHYCGVLIAVTCSILIGLRNKDWKSRICTMLGVFIVSLIVGALVVFGGCVLLLPYAYPHG